jgi:hypothetical protein
MEIQAVFVGQRGCGRMDEASSRRRRSVGRLCDTRWDDEVGGMGQIEDSLVRSDWQKGN